MKTDSEICETCDVNITLMTSCVGDVLGSCVKMFWCLHCSKCKLSSIKAFFMKFTDNIAR